MKFYLSLTTALLHGDLGTQRLFQGMNGGRDIRIHDIRTARRIILLNSTVRIARDQHLGLSNRVVSLNDLLGGVEYRTEVRERQERFGMAGSNPVFAQPLLDFRGQP